MISKYISLEEFCTCSKTFQKYSDQIDPYPWQPESIDAIASLCQFIIDPIIDHFGHESFQLTYGFCSVDLRIFLEKHDPETGKKNGRVCPKVDQHMAHEIKKDGSYWCDRLGASCDFLIKEFPSRMLVRHISQTSLPFDSIYFYGSDRPIHISFGPQHKRVIWGFTLDGSPMRLDKSRF